MRFFIKCLQFLESVIQRMKEIHSASTIHDTTKITYAVRIINHQFDKTKINIGPHCWIRGEIMLAKHGGEVRIGKHVFMGDYSRIWSACRVIIGDNVLISHIKR